LKDLPISDEQGETTVTQQPVEPEPDREICVTNAKGQKFCYEELKRDEDCNLEGPPICPLPKPEGITNESTLERSSVGISNGDQVPDTDVKAPCPRLGKPVCPS